MSGFIDLHCHWLYGLDDGASSPEAGRDILSGLRDLGFSHVVATPHMRPGLFDNSRADILAAFEAQCAATSDLTLSVSAEHYFDDVVYQRLQNGQGVPYPGQRAALLEFYAMDLPPRLDRLFAQLRRNGMTPVIAHPERYQTIWKHPETLERMLDAGAVALLDAAALTGKYGRTPRRVARQLLEQGMYAAACSDAHRPKDIAELRAAMDWISKEYGQEELEQLFRSGPLRILEGTTQP